MTVRLMPLEQVAKVYSGSNLKNGQDVFGEGGCPWVRVEDLNNAELGMTSRSLSLEGMKQAKISPEDTVFFASTGTIGKVGITRMPMAPSNNMIAVEFDPQQVFPLYGMYCLFAMKEAFQAEAAGAVYASLRLSVFRKFKIPVPPMEVQKKIAGKLTLLGKSEEQQRALADEIKQVGRGLFDKYFGDAAEQAMLQMHGRKLGEYADIALNGVSKKKTGDGVSACYVATAQLDDWEIVSGQAPRLEIETEKAERYYLHEGDIVMNRINSAERLGKCGIILEEPETATVFGQNTLRIQVKSRELEPLFLFVWLTHPYIKQYIRKKAKNSTSFQSSLNKQVLLDLPLPEVDLLNQKRFSDKLRYCFTYVRRAEAIIQTLEKLQQVWYDKIRLLLQQGETEPEAFDQSIYQEGRYWVAPSGVTCFYDSYLECIQVPGDECKSVELSQLPLGVEIQFLDGVRTVSQKCYGCLEHVRLKRMNRTTLQIIRMQPVPYRSGEETEQEELERQLEENGILSEQQDFGYIRRSREVNFEAGEMAEQFLSKYRSYDENGYSRFEHLPASARFFVSQLSEFQQAVFEEFLLAMQPLACHMVGKQVVMRAEDHRFQGCGIQDVIAAVRLLEHAGLLERRQGLYLNYDEDYRQGEQRQMILDHRGQPIPIDTWICADVKE